MARRPSTSKLVGPPFSPFLPRLRVVAPLTVVSSTRRAYTAQRKAIIADTRMQELQKDKRKLHKATEKQKQRDRKKDFKSAPPMRQV